MTTTPQAALLSRMDAYLSGNSCEATAIIKNARDLLAKLQATQEPVQAGELPPLPSSAHWEERIKTLMQQTPLPNSMSVYQAFKQFQNEFEHATVEYARAALSARKPLTDEQRKMFKNVTYMLDAYVECIKSSGEYEAWHYIPEIEATRDDLNSYVSDAHGIGLEVKP